MNRWVGFRKRLVRRGSAGRGGWPPSWSMGWKKRRQRTSPGEKERKMGTSPGRKINKMKSSCMFRGMPNRVIWDGKE